MGEDMEKPLHRPNVTATHIVDLSDTTPQILREYADRLDQVIKFANPGQDLLCPLTNGITLRFKVPPARVQESTMDPIRNPDLVVREISAPTLTQ